MSDERKRLGYLASPYMHDDMKIREQRFKEVAYIGAQIMASGDHVICPITMCHPMAMSLHFLPGDFKFWGEFDTNIISRCDYMVIAPLDGWLTSVGIRAEIKIAREFQKEIFMARLNSGHKYLGYDYYKGELDV